MFLFERNLLKERTDVIRLQCLDDSGHTIGSVQIWANSKPRLRLKANYWISYRFTYPHKTLPISIADYRQPKER